MSAGGHTRSERRELAREALEIVRRLLIALRPGEDPAVPPAREPVLEVDDIQGNILAGFNKDHQSLVFFQITDPDLAKHWLRGLIPRVASLRDVLAFNRLYKQIRAKAGSGTQAVRANWLNMAFTFPGLQKLTPDADRITDAAFKQGMDKRSQLLGDPTAASAAGNVVNWVIGGPKNVPDVLLLLASDNKQWLAEEVARHQEAAPAGLRLLDVQAGQVLPDPSVRGHEHFGFKDAISQPAIRGTVSERPDDWLTARESPADPNVGRAGQRLVWPGEFVFGYPTQDPTHLSRPGPIAEGGPAWLRNGSFLVFRRLRQDVEGFWRFVRTTAAQLSREVPEMGVVSPEWLASRLMGRWTSGAPILLALAADDARLAANEVNNNFRYIAATEAAPGFDGAPGDDAGLLCPYGSHIRKAYPRDDLARFDAGPAAETHRIIRRGIPYGTTGERGLLFLAYQTSLVRQFEFIVRTWLNAPDFREPGAGIDPVVGQDPHRPDRARRFGLKVRTRGGQVKSVPIELPTDWVVPTGGAYLFAPSIQALRRVIAA